MARKRGPVVRRKVAKARRTGSRTRSVPAAGRVIVIRLFVDTNGELRNVVKVDPGDIVRWVSDNENVQVSFPPGPGNPFTTNALLSSVGRGQPTHSATVRNDVPSPQHFECTIRIGGREFQHSVGVDTPGS